MIEKDSVYEKLMNEDLADFERVDNNPALNEVLHKVLPNSDEKTDNGAWEAALEDVLVNNDSVLRNWLS